MKKILIVLLIAMLAFAYHWNSYAEENQICVNCGASVTSNFCPECGHSATTTLPVPASDETYLSLKISYEKNKILAKYSADLYLDDVSLGSIQQAESLQKLIIVKKGIHEVKVSKGDKYITSILINAEDNAQLSFTLKAHLLSLEVKDVMNSCPVAEADQKAYALNKFSSECIDVNRERFCRYPEEFTNQKVHLRGRVIATAENFAGVMKVILKDSKNELWIVEYIRIKNQPRLLVNDYVDIYGLCKGITDYSSSVDNYPNLPTVTLSYLQLN